MLGKLNQDEFGMGFLIENSVYGLIVSLWKLDDGVVWILGGLLGGLVVVVVVDLCLGVMVMDIGGLIWQFVVFIGMVGLCLIYGWVSCWGVIVYVSLLDQVGLIIKIVCDVVIMLGVMVLVDFKDLISVECLVLDYEVVLIGDICGKCIGILCEYCIDGLLDEIDVLWGKIVQMLCDVGVEVVDIFLLYVKYVLFVYYVIVLVEVLLNFVCYDGVCYGCRVKLGVGDGVVEMYEKICVEGFGFEVQCCIMVGIYVLLVGFYDVYYNCVCKVCVLIKCDFDQVYVSGIDVILVLIIFSVVFVLGLVDSLNLVEMYLNDVFIVMLNFVGLFGILVLVGLDCQGLFLGMQLIGWLWDEGGLLNFVQVLEIVVGFGVKLLCWW